ncbi:amino acid adenylation domain-containing protein [Streptomyces sp. NPDC093089]|uniref:non-ribosomal peptide synthetase n=1 Tax=Streptomyces sp. NPDC093089 TaxID=3366024 RepID=UPI00382FC758
MTHGNLWQAFLRVARAHPDVEAFAGPDGAVDYRRLAAAAAAVADRLAARGVRTGDLVAVEVPVGPHFVVGALGALAVGAAYLPLDVSGPAKRREQIVADARPSVVLRTGDDALLAAASLLEVPNLPAAPAPERHDPATGEDDPAYVIYTSGSTGRPKGVVVPARGVHNLLEAFRRRAPLGPGARYSWWTSPGFDVSVYEMWSALLSGGTVVPVPDAYRRDIDATLDHLAHQRIGSAYLPPQFLPTLRNRIVNGGVVAPLRRLLSGVEPIPLGLLVDLRSHLPGLTVINGYGPTETTVCATLYTVPDRCADRQRRAPIGAVFEGNRGFVVDEGLTTVAPGQPGELCVAGRGLALGYLHDPQRTAERFVPAADGEGLMYRTGDLVLADSEGTLTFLGRIDDQLKIDGVRIEPAETEAALRRLDSIADVAVLARPASPGGPPVLTAFVVLSDEADDADEAAGATAADGDPWSGIRARLAEELPAQAVPRRFFALERIPMTSDGKLDRSALPQADDRPARPAANAHEHAVEDACRAVLPHAPSSLLDLGFAELGGDSLQATRLSGALRAATGRAVTVADILAAPTLADLAARIPALPAGHTPNAGDPGANAGDPGWDAVPLTPGQAGIWAAELMGASPGAFHESVAVELSGPLDPHRTAAELAAVLNRHAVFRGRVDELAARFVSGSEPLSVAVRSAAPGETVDHAWQRLVAELQRPAFDLARGPLVRAAVLAAPDTVRVLMVWHHLVVDAWSAGVVLEELAAALSGRASLLPEEHGYADYAHRQRDHLDSADGRQALRAAADRVRAWLPRGGGESGPVQDSCQVHALAVGPHVWSRVRDCARSNGTTAFAVTLAAVLDELCRLADTDGRFALAVADRDETVDLGAAGYFLTTVPFGPGTGDGGGDGTGDGDAAPSPKEMLRRGCEVVAEARALQRVPFPSLMAELGLRDARSVAPLVIAWDRDPVAALSVPGCTARSLSVDPLGARWPWTVLLTDQGDLGLAGRIECPPWVPAGRVAEFAARLGSLLDAFARAV